MSKMSSVTPQMLEREIIALKEELTKIESFQKEIEEQTSMLLSNITDPGQTLNINNRYAYYFNPIIVDASSV